MAKMTLHERHSNAVQLAYDNVKEAKRSIGEMDMSMDPNSDHYDWAIAELRNALRYVRQARKLAKGQ